MTIVMSAKSEICCHFFNACILNARYDRRKRVEGDLSLQKGVGVVIMMAIFGRSVLRAMGHDVVGQKTTRF